MDERYLYEPMSCFDGWHCSWNFSNHAFVAGAGAKQLPSLKWQLQEETPIGIGNWEQLGWVCHGYWDLVVKITNTLSTDLYILEKIDSRTLKNAVSHWESPGQTFLPRAMLTWTCRHVKAQPETGWIDLSPWNDVLPNCFTLMRDAVTRIYCTETCIWRCFTQPTLYMQLMGPPLVLYVTCSWKTTFRLMSDDCLLEFGDSL